MNTENENVVDEVVESVESVNTEVNATTVYLGKKLKAAGKLAEADQVARKEKIKKSATFVPSLVERAKAQGYVVSEQTSFFKVDSGKKGKNIYIAKGGGRMNLAGFTLDDPAVQQVSAEEAKQRHLGKVRGHYDFYDVSEENVFDVFDRALTELKAS